jgi:hypothetical protein
LFVGVVLLFPKGLVGAFRNRFAPVRLWGRSSLPLSKPEPSIDVETTLQMKGES